jgi:Fe-coproporphyrin III synthase
MSSPRVQFNGETVSSIASHIIQNLPILVLFPHSRCNCRCVMCDIWRIRQIREITRSDLEPHLESFRQLGVQWVVLSGGEPLMHSDLFTLVQFLRREGIRITLLTAGLTLERHADRVVENLDDIIVSLDGPREIHDRIRGVPEAYRRLERGINAVRSHHPTMEIHARCTVQRENVRHLRATGEAARDLGLDSISFLAVDDLSEAFNHSRQSQPEASTQVILNAAEVDGLTIELDGLIEDCQIKFNPGFVRESPEKLRRIEMHFRARLGQVPPVAPRCNAPWVSAVIESDGSVRPCFFHPPIGNFKNGTLTEILNSLPAVNFRNSLDIPNNTICKSCVCSLYLDLKGDSPGRPFAKMGISPPASKSAPNSSGGAQL